MYWTYEPPSQDGFYWVKHSNCDPWVVKVNVCEEGPYIYVGDRYVFIKFFNARHNHLFSNKPIEEPSGMVMPTRVERFKRIWLGAMPIDYSKPCMEQ